MINNKANSEKVIIENRCYVEIVAKQYLNQGIPLEQLIDSGINGLTYAIERHDADKDFDFMERAIWFVRASILQAIATVQNGESIPETFIPRKRKRVNLN